MRNVTFEQGPQYVCTNFSTFVCATCSGIHREFSHRVKSVSMATFTAEDVAGLREGGNEHAKEVYFRQWDSQHQSLPDNRNVEGLRKFIKHVYVDRRYCGEKESQKHGDRSVLHKMLSSDTYEQRSTERSGFSGASDERDSGNNYGERRNNGNGKESQKHVDRKRISTYFEVMDDRFRDDISETTETYNMQRKLSNQQIALDSSRPREVRSLRDILDRIPTLRLREALKEDGGRPSDSPSSMQRTETTTKPRHTDEHSTKPRNLDSMGNEKHTLGSAYSISSDPEPASKQSTKPSSQSISKPASSSSSNNPSTIGCRTPRNQSKAASHAKHIMRCMKKVR
ncbi:hypothetical protein V6Z11_A09G101400 [Gossypium hirsutum]